MVSVRRCYQYWRQYSVLSPAAAWPPPFLLKNISAQSTTRLQILGGVRGVYRTYYQYRYSPHLIAPILASRALPEGGSRTVRAVWRQTQPPAWATN